MRFFGKMLIFVYLSFMIVLFLLSYREHEAYTIVYSATVGFSSHEYFDVHEISLDGHSGMTITNGDRNFAGRFANDVLCSPNNEEIYVTARGLYRINRDGTGFTSLATRGLYNRMAIGADSSTIVVSGSSIEDYQNETDSNLYLYDINSQSWQLLTRGIRKEESPAWSPDMSKIAFTFGFNERSETGIAIINRDGSGEFILVPNVFYNKEPAWSPDGETIAFVSNRAGDYDLYTIRPDGSNMRQLTRMGSIISPQWSPDGRMISFSSNWRGDFEIYVIDPITGVLLQITEDRANSFNECWFGAN
jgi:dipeptidyl aminopeptidase/acylaminoacyl peptidase